MIYDSVLRDYGNFSYTELIGMKVLDVKNEDINRVQDFLENNSDTSLFLSSNLSMYGPKLGKSLNSGNFKYLESDGSITGVFCLTRRGNLLAETGGHIEPAEGIIDACASDLININGVIGEWQITNAIWKILLQNDDFKEYNAAKEVLYKFDLSEEISKTVENDNVRLLLPEDYEKWKPLYHAFMEEEEMPVQGTEEQQRTNFEENARSGHWWGYEKDGHLLAMVALNASYKNTGQVGGVYTDPLQRGKGLSSACMQTMINDCKNLHKLTKLILFTGENNTAAKAFYESLGFSQIGYYALFFGSFITDKA